MAAWTLHYYNASVAQQVERWPAGIRASYLRIAARMREHGPDLGMPYTRSMGHGLFEIRARGHEGIGRTFFCTAEESRIVILHAIIKKTEKTPTRDIETARARRREIMK